MPHWLQRECTLQLAQHLQEGGAPQERRYLPPLPTMVRFTLQRAPAIDVEMASPKAASLRQRGRPRLLLRRACAATLAVLMGLFLWSAVGVLVCATSVRLEGVYVEIVPDSDGLPETVDAKIEIELTNRLPMGHALRISSASCAVAVEADEPLRSKASVDGLASATLVRILTTSSAHLSSLHVLR